MKKLYIIEKRVWASGIKGAIAADKMTPPDSVILDEKWRANNVK